MTEEIIDEVDDKYGPVQIDEPCPQCGEMLFVRDMASSCHNCGYFEKPGTVYSPNTDYQKFLESKITLTERRGFEVALDELHPGNKPHQGDVIRWAAGLGSALIALRFGLGKTRIQCELARLISGPSGGKFLVICPLGARHQFMQKDGPALGMRWAYVRNDEEIQAADTPYLITNYERVRDGDITPALHDLRGVSLDEGSVLRSLGSKTYQVFYELLKDVPHRYVATATPDPNDTKELIYFAQFLGIMDAGQALTRWFKRDPQKAGHLTVHPLHEKDFWLWVSSWALFLFAPSDLGHSDDGYSLPELKVYWHKIGVDNTRAFDQKDSRGQHRLLLDAASGVTEAAAEKRETLDDRIRKMLEIVSTDFVSDSRMKTDEGQGQRHWLIWHHLEIERKAIERALPDAVTVYGSQELEVREENIVSFADGKIRILATKPEIAGSGCNFQYHCYSNVFLGVDYKFQDFIQAIHRTYRFQQEHAVEVHIIYAESEQRVVEVLKQKWEQYDAQVEMMRAIIRKYGLALNAMQLDMKRTIGVARMETKQTLFTAINNDCILEVEQMAAESVGLIHTSIPFGNHYEYSAQVEDLGHSATDAKFWEQMDFLIPNLLRVLKPGRVAAIHVKDRVLYGHQTKSGFMEISPFSDECTAAFIKHGFLYEGRRTIVTDVVRENASTYRLGWSEMARDASKMGCGLPEYLLLFRRPPSSNDTSRADEPVTKEKSEYTRARWQVDAHAFWRSDGDGPLDAAQLYDYHAHVGRLETLDRKGRLPKKFFSEPPKSESNWVWDNVVFMRTLNTEQSRKRQENHICPLPFDIVERTLNLYSNPGDVVLDPFAGLFTVPMMAIKMGRHGVGIELAADYYAAGVRYCQAAEQAAMMPTLFDYLEAAVSTDAVTESRMETDEEQERLLVTTDGKDEN